jgi:hypothetical protein
VESTIRAKKATDRPCYNWFFGGIDRLDDRRLFDHHHHSRTNPISIFNHYIDDDNDDNRTCLTNNNVNNKNVNNSGCSTIYNYKFSSATTTRACDCGLAPSICPIFHELRRRFHEGG